MATVDLRDATSDAETLVAHVLGRPLGQTSGTDVVDVRGRAVLLARTPVVEVSSVVVDDVEVVDACSWSAFGMLVGPWADVASFRHAAVTYTGGPDPEYPDVLAVVDAVAARLVANDPTVSAGAVRQESVGSYSVTYDPGGIVGANGLTASETAVLDRYRVRTEVV